MPFYKNIVSFIRAFFNRQKHTISELNLVQNEQADTELLNYV